MDSKEIISGIEGVIATLTAWGHGGAVGLRHAITHIEAQDKRLAELESRTNQLTLALRYYAGGNHFILGDNDAWDTVSGEPPNLWCDEAGTATVEDGTLAAMTLRGEYIGWDSADMEPIEGEK